MKSDRGKEMPKKICKFFVVTAMYKNDYNENDDDDDDGNRKQLLFYSARFSSCNAGCDLSYNIE